MAIPLVYPDIFRGLALFFATMVESEDHRQQKQYETAVKEHSALIDRICFGYAKTREDMEDLRQAALLNLWASMSKFNGDCSMKTWVNRLTLNSCVSTLRKNYRRPVTMQLAEVCDMIEDDQRQTISELHEGIAQLNHIDKAIVLLWLEDESYDEIASIVGLSKSNVAVRLHRAKDKLRTIMNR